jgi:hypothetical protein
MKTETDDLFRKATETIDGLIVRIIHPEKVMRHSVTLKKSNLNYIEFKVRAVLSTKDTAFWDVAPCSLMEFDRHFGGLTRIHLQGLRISQSKQGASVLFLPHSTAPHSNYYYKAYISYRPVRPTPTI